MNYVVQKNNNNNSHQQLLFMLVLIVLSTISTTTTTAFIVQSSTYHTSLLKSCTDQTTAATRFCTTTTSRCRISGRQTTTTQQQQQQQQQQQPLFATTADGSNSVDLNEFDHLLLETAGKSSTAVSSSRRRQIHLKSSNVVILSSSSSSSSDAAATANSLYGDIAAEAAADEVSTSDGGETTTEGTLNKIKSFTEGNIVETITTQLQEMDLQDMILGVAIPAIAVFAGAQLALRRVKAKREDAKEEQEEDLEDMYEDFLYADGYEDEMMAVIQRYASQRLPTSSSSASVGTSKKENTGITSKFKTSLTSMKNKLTRNKQKTTTTAAETDTATTDVTKGIRGSKLPAKLMVGFFAYYASKKTVSPETVSNLSVWCNLLGLSEDDLVRVFTQSSYEAIVSSGKTSPCSRLLYWGTCILTNEPAVRKLDDSIGEQLMETYYSTTTKEEARKLVDVGHKSLGETAYATVIQNEYKLSQDEERPMELTADGVVEGYDVLKIPLEEAQRIYEKVSDKGFLSIVDELYIGMADKTYDKKGNLIYREDGKFVNPDTAVKVVGDNINEGAGSFMVGTHECQGCGFTLFVAPGREEKMFPDSFKCPDCGEPKSNFKSGEELNH